MLAGRCGREVGDLCEAFVAALRGILRQKLHAVYVYGAVTFPETAHTGDVDFHVILALPPTAAERAALLALHEKLGREFPPLGAELDGYYILLEEARGSERPRHVLFPDLVDESWALHRAHILAGRVAVLHGPDPKSIYVAPTWEELSGALDGELDYVRKHLTQYPAYCVLNLCRLLYSWQTRDVVTSKAASARWALEHFPAWARLIGLALASYAKQATEEGERQVLAEVPAMFAFAAGKIAALRSIEG